jgi:hypothetical protein
LIFLKTIAGPGLINNGAVSSTGAGVVPLLLGVGGHRPSHRYLKE